MHGYKVCSPDDPFLLASDIDGTLLGDDKGAGSFRELVSAWRKAFILVYISGRSTSSILQLVEEEALPRPDLVCGFAGTELTDLRDSGNRMGLKYASLASPAWDLEALYRLGEGPGIRRQDFPDGQPRFHAGFFWDSSRSNLDAFRARLKDRKDISIYPAMDEYIDVFPAPLGKGGAVKFLRKELGMDKERVIVAGDSGNDRPMFETGFKGIMPVNALDELKSAADRGRHYLSPLPAASGVLDGLCRFGFLKKIS